MSRRPAPLVGDAELVETLRRLLGGDLERANRIASRVGLLQLAAEEAGRLWPHRDKVDEVVRAEAEGLDAEGREGVSRALDAALLRRRRGRRGE